MKIYQVDSFAMRPFEGNPAAVCVLESPKDEEWMQNLAEEMNLSETAYLVKQDNGYSLRWFTPTAEVELCGHATLASAHILWEQGFLDESATAVFYTLSGELGARKTGDWIEMDFPSEEANPCPIPDEIGRSLGVNAVFTGKNRMDWLIEVESEEVLRSLKPDYNLMMRVPSRGVIVTSSSDDPAYDFLSRFFCPWHGINEDPVTGSAHCCTGPYWREKLGKDELTAYQASKRGGTVKIKFSGDRVLLSGQAITVMVGELDVSILNPKL